jgi:hypothetical protein
MSTNQEHAAVKLVWYASYGSNLKRERFMCYIKGGTPPGSTKRNDGCFQDKSDPIESRPISLKLELYFAGQSYGWPRKEKNGDVPGGVAFIRANPERGPTLGRMYLITDEQFNDVVMQENSKKPDGSRFVPAFNQLVSQPQSILPGNPWYGKLLNIGSEEGCPILTFTTARTDLPNPNAPGEQYVKVIASGIKETYPRMSDSDVVNYLLQADGVRGLIDPTTIQAWVATAP